MGTTTPRGGTVSAAHPPRDESEGRDDAGAILILALVFLVAVSLIVTGLLTFVGGSLRATASFSNERSVEAAATSAVNLAIQNSRFTFAGQMQNAFGNGSTGPPPSACWFDGSGNPQQPPAFNGVQVDVWCSMVWQPYSANTRTITYSACSNPSDTAAQCAATPLLQAVEVFDDYPPGIGVPLANPVQCNYYNYCGQSMTQVSWQWTPTVPAVTSISPTSTTIAGGVPLTINGTGLLQGSSVRLVQESGGTATSANVVITIPAAQVTCNSPTNGTCASLTVTAPSVTSGTAYFVTVTGPTGTSAFVATGALSYPTPPAPTVTGISGTVQQGGGGAPSGSITGGSTVTISGTGFFNASNFAAQVWFWSGSTKFAATNVNVTSETTLTAVTPAVTSPGNWYAQVDTLGGNSLQTSYVFNYTVQVPIIVSISPSSGGPSTQMTISGANFLTGSTVGFCLDTNGNYNAGCPNQQFASGYVAASATVTSPASITVTIPTSGLTNGSSYYPIVTLPSPYNGTPSQPYNLPEDVFTFT